MLEGILSVGLTLLITGGAIIVLILKIFKVVKWPSWTWWIIAPVNLAVFLYWAFAIWILITLS